MPTTLDRNDPIAAERPEGFIISGFQESMSSSAQDWRAKLGVWNFGFTVVQKMERSGAALKDSAFYESMLLSLLALGSGFKGEIDDPELAGHFESNLENLSSKYITLKMPPLEGPNRLLNLIAA